MEYILNESKIKTTNNFKINNIKVDLDIPKNNNFNNYKISNEEVISNIMIKNDFDSLIGLKDDKYLNVDINVDKNVKDTILIEYDFSNDYLASTININIDNDKECNFIIKYKSDVKAFNNSKIVVNLGNNSKCKISVINTLNSDSINLLSMENNLNENSNLDYNFIDLKGNIRIYNYSALLNGKNARNNFNNIYIGKDHDRIDMNYLLSNIAKRTYGNMNVQGALTGNAYKTFKGTIDFIKGCTKSKGEELENCILLSNTCKSSSLPMLLCHEEDVEGAHGVSSGKIDDDKLFYLMSRGIDEKNSKKMIVNANFNSIINNIDNEKIKDEILNIIDSLI